MSDDDRRSIELEIEVPGTPEEVWQAVATGPGISSWYVPHEVEEREGGAMSASFGEGPEMQVSGRVAAWDPPHRAVFDGGDVDGLAFEWLVEARDGGTCIVRLINSGFGKGGEWDDQYDAMREGWTMFLANLRQHLSHFAGQSAVAQLPMTMVATDPTTAWTALTDRLGVPANPSVGDEIRVRAEGLPSLGGTVAELVPGHHILLICDEPAPGTAFIAAEGHGSLTGVSIWAYLYGAEGAEAGKRDAAAWQKFLAEFAEAYPPPS